MTRKKPTKREQVDAAVSYALASPYTAEIVREILREKFWPEFHACGCHKYQATNEWIRCKAHQKEYERRMMDPPRSCACGAVNRLTRYCASRNRGKIHPGDMAVNSYEDMEMERRGHICKAPTPAYLEWRR